jgi:hypothetical protein
MSDDRPQPLRALDLANARRLARAEARRRVARREVSIAAVILGEHEPEACARTAVIDVLGWAPRVGVKIAAHVLEVEGVTGSRALESLTPNERRRLLRTLRTLVPTAVPDPIDEDRAA